MDTGERKELQTSDIDARQPWQCQKLVWETQGVALAKGLREELECHHHRCEEPEIDPRRK